MTTRNGAQLLVDGGGCATASNATTSSSISVVATVWQKVLQKYRELDALSDPRSRDWPLVNSPDPMLLLVMAYIALVWLLPPIMKRSKPFGLQPLLVVYNLAIATLNAHIAKELFVAARHLNYSFRCEPPQVDYQPNELRMVRAIWCFYISKLLELADTLFFILRKKTRQLTFLHVYHHSTMIPLWWIPVKWLPSGSTFLPAMINSSIHVLMYGYYALSALGPRMQRFLWWKQHLTLLQLAQFTFCLLWSVQALLTDCDFPRWVNYLNIVYQMTFLLLFGRFYGRTYKKMQTNKRVTKTKRKLK